MNEGITTVQLFGAAVLADCHGCGIANHHHDLAAVAALILRLTTIDKRYVPSFFTYPKNKPDSRRFIAAG